uniref:Putative secreted protein n=1 Tax=Ixodes ricinus TaxID=34613 RepID=A0A6B0U0D1_IXORI
MLGMSSSSPKTYTPGASVTCLMSSAAAAPLAVLAKSRYCSSCDDCIGAVGLLLSDMACHRRVQEDYSVMR